MVDRHPLKSIVYLGSASADNVSSGWQSTMSSRKECNIYILVLGYSSQLAKNIWLLEMFIKSQRQELMYWYV